MCFVQILRPFLTRILTADCSVCLIWKYGLRRMWRVDRRCLLLLDTLCVGSVFAPFSDLYFLNNLWNRWLFVIIDAILFYNKSLNLDSFNTGLISESMWHKNITHVCRYHCFEIWMLCYRFKHVASFDQNCLLKARFMKLTSFVVWKCVYFLIINVKFFKLFSEFPSYITHVDSLQRRYLKLFLTTSSSKSIA
jgi:hypothetical protein